MEMQFSKRQAAFVSAAYDHWYDYYTDGACCDEGNLDSCDMTLEQAQQEQEKAKQFAWKGLTFTFIPGASLLSDICHALYMIRWRLAIV